jgi:YVTN family beta-propeller protein
VATQHGLVLAQNMIYRHTISVFDDGSLKLLKTISDKVRLADFGYTGYSGTVHGGPVEAAISPDGRYAYVSNYSMYGPGFSHPGHDVGGPASGFDKSFVYRIPLDTLVIDKVIAVGSVPKYLAVTPDGRYLLVSNWDSYTVSVVDTTTNRQVRQIKVGAHPRGIAIDAASRYAYIAVMGSTKIARIDLETFALGWIRHVGSGPRHLVLSPAGDFLYVTLNGSGKVAKIRISTGKVVKSVSTGGQPRSMTMAEDGLSLYVVNYASSTVSKIRTSDMRVIQTVRTDTHPIGITYVDRTRQIWVSCYSGSILVFSDR